MIDSKAGTVQTTSKIGPNRLRKLREVAAFSGDGKLASTFQASYQVHDVKTTLIREREEYAKNKGKAAKGGEWWGQETKLPAGKHLEDTHSCYRESFKVHDYRMVRDNMISQSLYMRPRQSAMPNTAPSKPVGENGSSLSYWFQFRMRKPARDDPGKHYDILTGQELSRAPSGIYDPTKNANRISIDKMNALKQGRHRNYNIISNQEFAPGTY